MKTILNTSWRKKSEKSYNFKSYAKDECQQGVIYHLSFLFCKTTKTADATRN